VCAPVLLRVESLDEQNTTGLAGILSAEVVKHW
jgi:hypothetical protein